jgi:hypothetical protein
MAMKVKDVAVAPVGYAVNPDGYSKSVKYD